MNGEGVAVSSVFTSTVCLSKWNDLDLFVTMSQTSMYCHHCQGIENLSTLRPVQLLGIRAVKRALPGLSTNGCMTLGSSVYLMYSGVEHKLNML